MYHTLCIHFTEPMEYLYRHILVYSERMSHYTPPSTASVKAMAETYAFIALQEQAYDKELAKYISTLRAHRLRRRLAVVEAELAQQRAPVKPTMT